MRKIVINQGAHPIKAEQFPEEYQDGPIIPASKGNLKIEEFREAGMKAAKMLNEEDVLVLTGPGICQVVAVSAALVKFPQGVKLAQFSFDDKAYHIIDLGHNELRAELCE